MIKKNIAKRWLVTLFIASLFLLGSLFPLPGISTQPKSVDPLFNLMNFVSGGSFQSMGFLALGLSPYITASLFVQLLSNDNLGFYKETSNKQKKITYHTKVLTLFVALAQSFILVYNMSFASFLGIDFPDNSFDKFLILLIFSSGSMMTYFLGEMINRHGIGNGISVLISAGIIPQLFKSIQPNNFVLFVFATVILFIISISASKHETIIPLQSLNHDRRLNAHSLSIKLLQSSVIPIIFATSLISIINIIANLFSQSFNLLQPSQPVGVLLLLVFIIYFSYSFNKTQLNGNKIKNDLIKSYMYIPNVPLNDTPVFINKIADSFSLKGSLVLFVLVALSLALEHLFNVSLSGTSILILISTAFELIYQTKALSSEFNISKIIESEV